MIANRYSLLYTLWILASIIISIILLGNWINNALIIFIMGSFALICTILPLVFKEKIEKLHGYRELAADFKNLEQDFRNKGNTSSNLERFKIANKKLATYPIDGYTKWRMK
jgi:hypothetical protein